MDTIKYIKLENEDGTYSDNIPLAVTANEVEVMSNGSTTQLSNYITENNANILSLQTQTDNNASAIQGLASGSPKGSYNTVSALVNANPATGVYIIAENKHIYSWIKNGTTAVDLGLYEIGDFNETDGALKNWLWSISPERSIANLFSTYLIPNLDLDNSTGEASFVSSTASNFNKRATTIDFIAVEPNVKYGIKNEIARTSILVNINKYVFFYDSAYNFISYTSWNYITGATGYSFQTPANTAYIKICLRSGNSAIVFSNELLSKCADWRLFEMGLTQEASEYIPGRLISKNAINYDWNSIDTLEDKIARFSKYKNNSKNICIATFIKYSHLGDTTAQFVTNIETYDKNMATKEYMPIKANTTYRLSVPGSEGLGLKKYIQYYDSNYNMIGSSRTTINLNAAFTTPENAAYYRVEMIAPTSSSAYGPGTDYPTAMDWLQQFRNWQIEEGTEVTDYVPPFLIETDNINFDFEHIQVDPEDVAEAVDTYLSAGSGIVEPIVIDGLKTLINLNRNGRYPNIAFFTDTHSNDNDATKAINYMTKISKSGMIDMCIHGGDVISTYVPTTVDEYIETIIPIINQYKNIDNLYFVKGNHDDGHTNTQAGDITRFQYNVIFNNDAYSNKEKMFFNNNDKYGNYYYIDNEYLKLRTIVLDSFYAQGNNSANWGAEQKRWLAEEAFNTMDKDNWTVILYSHYGIGNMGTMGEVIQAYNEKSIYDTCDYSNDTCKFVGCICGHNHSDNYANPLGFNVIHVLNAFGTTPGLSLFTIDTDNHVLYETRIGRGSSRSYTYGDNTAHKL